MAVVAVAAATGCGSAGHPAASSPSGSHPPAASPSGSSPALATGPELARLLPPQVAFLPGWTTTRTANAWNRNPRFSKPVAALGSALPGASSCTNWNISVNTQTLMYDWEMAFAIAFATPPHRGLELPVELQIADFRPGDAARQLAEDAAFARHCHTYRDPGNGSQVTITAAPVPGLGSQSLYVQLVNPYPFGQGVIIHAHANVLLVRVGNDMVGVNQGGNATNPLDRVAAFSYLRQAAGRLIGLLTSHGIAMGSAKDVRP